jgi:hypothetical protein
MTKLSTGRFMLNVSGTDRIPVGAIFCVGIFFRNEFIGFGKWLGFGCILVVSNFVIMLDL